MRPFLILFLMTMATSWCFGQRDTTKPTAPTLAQPMVPGVESPISAPGTLMQSSPRPNAVAPTGRTGRKRRLRTAPPSDPRAFGVAVPVGETKKDTVKNK